MKKGRVFFHPIEGSGALTISWTSASKGDAVEAKKGSGVGFFSESGELLCVIFDEVLESQDQQTLKFNHYRVEIDVKNGKVDYSVMNTQQNLVPSKKHSKPKSKNSRVKRRPGIKTRF